MKKSFRKHRKAARGAGTSEGQGGAAFSKGTFNTVSTVITTNIAFLYCQTIKHFNKARVLRVRRINIKKEQKTNYQLRKGRFKNVTPEL